MSNEGKTVKSFSLAQDVLDEIERVRKEKKLKSSSAALERIVLSKQVDITTIKEIINQMVNQIIKDKGLSLSSKDEPVQETKVEEEVIDEIEAAFQSSVNDIFKNMDK